MMVLLYDLVMYNKWLGVESLVLYDDGSSVYLYMLSIFKPTEPIVT